MKISLEEAVQLLRKGKTVAVPTETVYGLAASIMHPQAIENIFVKKKRPANNPLIIHASSLQQIESFANVDPEARKLAEFFWPGPLTMVLEANISNIPSIVRAGLDTAAFRIPLHEVALKLIEQVGPVVMPSANLSGKPSATMPEHVEADFGKDFPVLDGGATKHGLESTIIILRHDRWEIIRLGAIPAELFESCLGYIPKAVISKKDEKPLCPGQMYRHYAPKAKLLFTSMPEKAKGVVIGFKDRKYLNANRVFSLGNSSNADEIAENLYSVLRQLDEESVTEAFIDANMPHTGLWATIVERLHKAAEK